MRFLKGPFFMQGDEACAEGAIVAGCRLFAGYPITPSTEIAERLASRLPQVGGAFLQMEDEISSIALIIGASYAGAKVMTASSGPGMSLMMENIGLAFMTESPIVIVNVMRGGPSTGQPTRASQGDVMQAKWGSHGDYEIIALSPFSVQEMFDLTIRAFNLAEQFRTPVIILSDEIIGHMREKVVIKTPNEVLIINRKKPQKLSDYKYFIFKPEGNLIPPMACFGEGYKVHVTGLTHDLKGFPNTIDPYVHSNLVRRLCDKIRLNADKIIQLDERFIKDAEILVVSYGVSARSALMAVRLARERGIKVGLCRLITIWPFPQKKFIEYSHRIKEFIVVEMNYGQIIREIERSVHGKPVHLLSKLGGDPPTPEEILNLIIEVDKNVK
ncbi:MAG: 2-oxoacid:acceptor oxidoreductase subunit alpha [Candidatus Methanomethylicia archaeon]